jgi:hypothetical protein
MDDGVDLGPRLVDRTVDEPLQITRPRVVHRRAVELELDDVGARHELRAERAREQVMIRLARMADADMAVGVDHILLRQNAVGDHQVADRAFQIVHAEPPRRVVA